MKIKTVYNEKQVAISGSKISPSAIKPKLLSKLLVEDNEIEIIDPIAVSLEDIKRCHNPQYVDDIMSLKIKNGFGTYSQSVVDSLPYTNGAMYTAAKLCLTEEIPVAALVSGFHHAGYNGYSKFGYFCTFNGLMITACKLIQEDKVKKVAIIDCDQHYGNGTDNILNVIDPNKEKFLHETFGKYFENSLDAQKYLEYFDVVKYSLMEFKPDVIIYQSGADVHINDPFGGVLTEEQMYERDVKMFSIARDLHIPICWDLAGGYQIDEKGGCDYVLQLHLNTFKACKQVYF